MNNEQLERFSAPMIAGCEAALEAGVFYQDAFEDFVFQHMGGYGCDCDPVLVEFATLHYGEGFVKRKRELSERLASSVKGQPVGRYAVIDQVYEDGRHSYSSIASDGRGGVGVGGGYDSYDEVPTGEKILRRLFAYEIYLCRKVIEEKRRIEANIQAQKEHGFTAGMELKNYRHPGVAKAFSKAVVQSVHPESGTLKILLVRRGTGKRWETTVGAKRFAEDLAAHAQ